MVTVIESECTNEGGKLTVVVEGDNHEELTNADARQLAIATASKTGFGACGISGQSGPYPAGTKLADVVTKLEDAVGVIKFRNDIYLTQRI